MESTERLVLHNQVSDGDGFGNRLVVNAAIPLPGNLRPRQATLQLFENNPHHDPRALECWLPAANRRIRDDVPAQFHARAMSVGLRFHNGV